MKANRLSLTLLAVVGGALACSQSAQDPASFTIVEDAVFLSLDRQPQAVMDALFNGRIVLDDDGCLRTDSGDRPTIVWPHGYRLESDGGVLRVVNAQGGVAGRIGGSFRLGGGEVPMLHSGIEMSADDRARAASRCPGRFWITGDVLSP